MYELEEIGKPTLKDVITEKMSGNVSVKLKEGIYSPLLISLRKSFGSFWNSLNC